MSSDNVNRQIESGIESFFRFLYSVLKKIVVGIFRGIRKLTSVKCWIGLGVAVAVAAAAWTFKEMLWLMLPEAPVYIHYLLLGMLLAAPALYLMVIGGSREKTQETYEQIFKDIGFVGKDGKVPYFCGSNRQGKKQILVFKSTIPLQDWKSAENKLETGLDCNILQFEYGSSKRIVKLITVPSECKIPDKLNWQDTYAAGKDGVITIGQGAIDTISFDLNRVPHVLVAGETGSGKSVILRCMLWQMILANSRVYMIDFKGGVEFGKQYEKYGEVITERERALQVLDILTKENEKRLKLFRDLEVKNLTEYNRKTHQNLCRIGVFTDELAEMLDKTGISKENRKIYEEIEGKLSTLARLSRATGINLFFGVQRPDAKVLTGQIKNNVPVRISGRFADKSASEIVLGNTAAVDLPDIKGRFLYKVGNETIEFQAYYFDDDTMLRDVAVEVGSMLIDNASNGKTGQAEGKATQGAPQKKEMSRKRKTAQKIQKEVVQKEQTAPQADSYLTVPDISGCSEEETAEILAEMDEFDLNLNFGEEE